MESKDDIIRFDGIIRFSYGDVNFSDILLDEKLYKVKNKIIFIYKIPYKSIDSKSLQIRFDEIDGFIKNS